MYYFIGYLTDTMISIFLTPQYTNWQRLWKTLKNQRADCNVSQVLKGH